MTRHAILAVIAAAVLMAASAAQPTLARPYHAPRTAFGQPDLQGFWTNASLTKLERPAGVPLTFATHAEEDAYEARRMKAQAEGEASGLGQGASEWHPAFRMARVAGRLRTSFIVSPADGRLPYRPEALARFEAFDAAANRVAGDNPEQRTLGDRCLIGGFGSSSPPMMAPAVSAVKQIVQTRNEVAILSEMNHDVRIVRLNGRHPPPNVRLWMGDSIGHWDGATLVVETTNYHPQEQFHGIILMSPDARVTERFTRTGPTEILYAFEVDDPAIYTVPWRAEMPLKADTGPIYEFACHEGNYGLPDILAGARRAEASAAAQPSR
jgi:hypothetical protein